MWFAQAQAGVELQIGEHKEILESEWMNESFAGKLYRKNLLLKICDKLSPKPVQENIHVRS